MRARQSLLLTRHVEPYSLNGLGGSRISTACTEYDGVEMFETAYVIFCGVDKGNTVNAESNRSAFEPTPLPQTTCDVFRLPVTL